ncbi:MAG: hypothetical protein ACMV1B_11755, partial [Prevotella sp.]
MIKYPSIEQFRNVISTIQRTAQFVRYDTETNQVITDPTAKLPVITAIGTEKIHGCFEKNTLVTLANGEEVPISKLDVGTYILSFNTVTGVDEYKKITGVIKQ